MQTLPKFYSIQDLRNFADYTGSHWFSKNSMAFFKTRLTENFRQLTDTQYKFITTEKGPSGERKASIRIATLELTDSGFYKVSIETLGEFNSMSLASAKSIFKRI